MQTELSFSSDGLELRGNLHLPDGAEPGSVQPDRPLPAFLILHGFADSKDAKHTESQAEMIASLGYAAFRFDFRGCGVSDGEQGQVRCFDQVADTKNALTFLAGRPEIDPGRIGVLGHSFGAAVAVYAAGVDERIACVISSCGWGHGERKFRGQHPTPEAWDRFMGLLEEGRRHKRETGESMWISRFDAVPIPEHLRSNLSPKAKMEIPVETAWSMLNFRADDVVADIAPRPVLFLHTADDQVTPTEQSIRMFELAGHPAELMLVHGTSHFPFADEDAPRTRSLVSGWLERFFPLEP